MATIKLQAGKVLTTNQRVRCKCCIPDPPDECCPYPAEKLNVLYRREDLPESLVIANSYNSNAMAMSLTSSGSSIYQGTDPTSGDPSRIIITGSVWDLQILEPNSGNWFGVQDWSPQGCLLWDYSDGDTEWPISPPDPQGGGGFSYPDDNFQDTYTVTQTQPARTFTVTRESLCVWRSRNANGDVDNVLYYDTEANEQGVANSGIGRVLWRFNGSYRSDAGPYNSPAGVYGDTWTVV